MQTQSVKCICQNESMKDFVTALEKVEDSFVDLENLQNFMRHVIEDAVVEEHYSGEVIVSTGYKVSSNGKLIKID